jgi:diguanylate cyclase (GGDEF)-like protein
MDNTEVRPKLLVIDDDDQGRLLTVLILEERGFSVTEADCGEQAIGAVGTALPDAVLLDALMPGMDGFETCRRIRAIPGAEHLPILMLTGLTDDESVIRAYEAGATDFFVKSEHWTLLAQRIRYLLRASRMRGELVNSRAQEAWAQRIAKLGYWEWDVVNRMFMASEECFHLIGRADVPTSGAGSGALPMSVSDIARFFQYLHAEDRIEVESTVARALSEGGSTQFECRLVGLNNAISSVHLEIEVERDTEGVLSRVYGVIQDISERKQSEDQIRVLANFDSLTGLSNRRQFHEQFARALDRARPEKAPVALLFLDLDRLRHINDTLGYAAGDQLLSEVALRLNQSIHDRGLKGASGDLVARLGGDQFAIMLTGLSSVIEAEVVAQCVRAELCKPICLIDQECITSAAIGIAVYPRDGNDAETLMRNADIAMNSAKTSGVNALQVYKPGLNATTKERLVLEQALHKALDRNQLIMYYQPQIDTRLGKIIGAEALMRWQLDGRLVPPGEFISIAEEVGLIVSFGEWAINNVVGQNHAWIDVGFDPLPIAVNIPGGHFERNNFVEMVQEILTRQRIAPEFLELEITETSVMRNLATTLPTLDALTALGIRLSIDDFGTGYSSLSYLRRLPIDTLKIDASFVRELKKGSDSEAIVAAIIAMAKSLDLRVIAEGVETEEQMSLLHAYGCHIMQGYYFSKPIPAADFSRFRLEYGGQMPMPKKNTNGGRSKVSPLRSAVFGVH